MLLTEYEGKSLLCAHGIRTPGGTLIRRPAQLRRLRLTYPVALKAQVRAGGRGKAGGIARADDEASAQAAALRLFGLRFGDEPVRALLVEPWVQAARELYLAVTVDGNAGGYVVLYAPSGGMDVEQAPDLLRFPVGAPGHFRGHRLRAALLSVEPDAALRERIVALARRLLEIASTRDCITVEINPLFVLDDGNLVAADAKVVRDEAAAFRQDDVARAIERDRRALPRPLREALAGDLMLVWLDGEIGLISGGAGMTMAAMDLIADTGCRPACFLDCSANPTPDGYRLAFRLLDREPRVKAILVAIFGGGTHMDRVARTMSDIMRTRRSNKPVVFRLNGTQAERVPAVFEAAGLVNHVTIEDAVAQVAQLARRGAA